MSRILLAPDLHCCPSNYGRVGPDGVHSRLAEWRRCADALVRVACDHECDVAVFPGDFFTHARPSPTQVLDVVKLFRDLAAAGIPVVGCPGNHDLVPGQAGPCDLVAAAGESIWSLSKPDLFTLCPDGVLEPGLQIAVLPAVKPSSLLAEAHDPVEATQLVSQRLIEVARGLRLQCSDEGPRVLIGHWTVAGAEASSGQVLCGASEPTLPLAELIDQGWDAVLLGHIHKPQVLNERPFIGYAGSLLRNDFGEALDSRGCIIVDLDAGTHERVDLPARRFVTLDLRADPELQEDDSLEYVLAHPEECLSLPHVRDAVVRVLYRATEELARGVDHGAIIRALETAGAHHVAGVFPEIIRADRARAAGLTEAVKPLEALVRWLAPRTDVSADVAAKALVEIQRLLEEVA